ncbi:metallophosphoesterase family protein [soil metagenome]
MTAARIAIFGDLHANADATRAVLADIDAAEIERMYCLGDLVGYGAEPNETIDLVHDRDIPTITGNYDDGVGFDRDDCGCAYRDAGERERGQQSLMWTREQVTPDRKAWLRTLLPEIRLDERGHRIRLVHGSPRRMNEYLFADRDQRSLERIADGADCDILIFGHTHIPWDRDINGIRFVNAGSVGKPKDGDPRAAWLLVEVDDDGVEITLRRVEYDVANPAARIRAAEGLPDRFAADIETAGRTSTSAPLRP